MSKSFDKTDLTEDNYKRLLEKAYERYKLDWMLNHDCTLTELITGLDEYIQNTVVPDGLEALYQQEKQNIPSIFEEWEFDIGFAHGTIWTCRREFESTEFQDKGYMQHLLSKEDYLLWKTFRKQKSK